MKKITSLFFLLHFFIFSYASKHPRNVIFFVAEGLGTAQIYATMLSNIQPMAISQFNYIGFSKTHSANKFVPDGAAASTALACGIKTNNNFIGMSPDSLAVLSVLEVAATHSLATGIVSTCALTNASTAAFIAHQVDKNMFEEIALDYVNSSLSVMIGGGRNYFEDRLDDRNLTEELRKKNFQVVFSLDEMQKIKVGKLAGLLYNDQNPPMPQRGPMLPNSTQIAIDLLKHNKKGFFLVVQSAQMDWAAHANDSQQIIRELTDFDQAIAKAIDFAKIDGNTLVVVTSTFETGGMLLSDTKSGSSMFAEFQSTTHTGTPVPVFAFGPGAEMFTGFYDNSSFKQKFEILLKFMKAK